MFSWLTCFRYKSIRIYGYQHVIASTFLWLVLLHYFVCRRRFFFECQVRNILSTQRSMYKHTFIVLCEYILCIFGLINYCRHILFTCCSSTFNFFIQLFIYLLLLALNLNKIYMYDEYINLHITSAFVNKYIPPLFAFAYTCLS